MTVACTLCFQQPTGWTESTSKTKLQAPIPPTKSYRILCSHTKGFVGRHLVPNIQPCHCLHYHFPVHNDRLIPSLDPKTASSEQAGESDERTIHEARHNITSEIKIIHYYSSSSTSCTKGPYNITSRSKRSSMTKIWPFSSSPSLTTNTTSVNSEKDGNL